MEKVFQITFDAQVLWGSTIVCMLCGRPPDLVTEYCCLNDNGVTPIGFAWQYHVQQLSGLCDKEKLKYVARFLDRI
jgi:hypothetical protein